MEDFATFIEKQRTDLLAQRRKIEAEKAALDNQIAEIDTELKAITAYERAKRGNQAGSTTKGTRRSGVRDSVLTEINKHPGGISRGDLLAALDAKDNKKAETSVSNAVANLKKAGTITTEDGLYRAT